MQHTSLFETKTPDRSRVSTELSAPHNEWMTYDFNPYSANNAAAFHLLCLVVTMLYLCMWELYSCRSLTLLHLYFIGDLLYLGMSGLTFERCCTVCLQVHIQLSQAAPLNALTAAVTWHTLLLLFLLVSACHMLLLHYQTKWMRLCFVADDRTPEKQAASDLWQCMPTTCCDCLLA